MNTLKLNATVVSPKQDAVEIVIAELERNLAVLESNYRMAVSNLNSLRECVDTDDLTRLLRRGAFMKKLHNLLTIAEAEGREVQVLMIDLDHFKRVNDTYGHQTGDVVLERVSELIRGYLRSDDLAGRYGGEEIIVAFEGSKMLAKGVAENIRKAVESHTMKSSTKAEFQVTLSMGVASTQKCKYEADSLISKADAALYTAKNTGRNKVVMTDDVSSLVSTVEHATKAA